MRVRNLTPHSGTFNVSATMPSGSPHTISIDEPSFHVNGFSDHFIDITLTVPAATVGASNLGGLSFQEVAGLIEVTPSTPSTNNGIKARVPYYFVPRALSDIETKLGNKPEEARTRRTTANITNDDGVIAGDADFYAWGLSDGKDAGKVSNDVRAIGVQSFLASDIFGGFAPRPGSSSSPSTRTTAGRTRRRTSSTSRSTSTATRRSTTSSSAPIRARWSSGTSTAAQGRSCSAPGAAVPRGSSASTIRRTARRCCCRSSAASSAGRASLAYRRTSGSPTRRSASTSSTAPSTRSTAWLSTTRSSPPSGRGHSESSFRTRRQMFRSRSASTSCWLPSRSA